MLIKLAAKSLMQRRVSALLTVMMIAVSVFVLLSVEMIRYQAKDSFGKTVSGVDLLVGARTGQLNLLLHSVFQIGYATNNISWQSYQTIAKHSKVAWTIPISMGDSHRGYRVMGTTQDMFNFFSYGEEKSLNFAQGDAFNTLYDAVIGADAARKLIIRWAIRLFCHMALLKRVLANITINHLLSLAFSMRQVRQWIKMFL